MRTTDVRNKISKDKNIEQKDNQKKRSMGRMEEYAHNNKTKIIESYTHRTITPETSYTEQ